jgi:hypothetical protein
MAPSDAWRSFVPHPSAALRRRDLLPVASAPFDAADIEGAVS